MKPRGIVIHTVGVRGDTTADAIRKYHVEHNKWADIGYHLVVRKRGEVEFGRMMTRYGAHTQGANDTIGIVVTGDGDHEDWTPQQWEAVLRTTAELCQLHNWTAENVCGHREAPARLHATPTHKTCPGLRIDMEDVRRRIALRLAGVA